VVSSSENILGQEIVSANDHEKCLSSQGSMINHQATILDHFDV
jgi:hypothetical protein